MKQHTGTTTSSNDAAAAQTSTPQGSMIDMPQMDCPACHGATLSAWEHGLQCSNCGKQFPVDAQGTLIAVPDPVAYLQGTGADLVYHRARVSDLAKATRRAKESMPWRGSPTPLIEALEDHLSLIDSQIDDLKRLMGVLDAEFPNVRPAETTSWGAGFTDFIYYDWSNEPFAAAQRDKLVSRVLSMVEKHADMSKPSVLLGGGAGRHFFDLAKRMPLLSGCDLDYTYVNSYCRLFNQSISIHDFHAPMISGNTLVTSERVSLPSERPVNARHYYVADATRLPLADTSVDSAIAIYLTDCVPLPVLLDEMRRILPVGGKFISAGPLIYRDVSPEHWYIPEEVMKIAEDWGFQCEYQEWMELPYWGSPHKALEKTHRVWTYVLRKTERSGA